MCGDGEMDYPPTVDKDGAVIDQEQAKRNREDNINDNK